MANTSIEWTNLTWNPIRGCSRVSRGCESCYAERQAHRFSGKGKAYEGLTRLTKHGPVWTGKIKLVPEVLEQPLHWRKPARVFVNSMSDLFHESVPDEFIEKTFAIMGVAMQHTFQVLTKRPERMRYIVSRFTFEKLIDHLNRKPNDGGENFSTIAYHGHPPEFRYRRVPQLPFPNVHLGVSCEDQETADERIPLLLQTPAAVRFVSLEPLLGRIDLSRWFDCAGNVGPCSNHRPDWVIVGGESGPGARPMHPDWARSLRDECTAARVPFFFKQWGEWITKPKAADHNCRAYHFDHHHEWSDDKQCAYRVGKKAAGAILDGREWKEFPQ